MAQKDKGLEEIWNELLQLHWEYLETEENMQKIDMRKRLEGDLRDFLSIVQHDRKFFLTETAHVLKQSITMMPDFTAYKALIGFEAITQYANNLFRKPWRKEYRCIKMYSGYYQHEVKANLLDAEKLFEAMGYTLLPNQTLVLDGPICPDQVTNVSRDAMTAYVECQIMKQIYHGLTAIQLTSTWRDIFKYREIYTGSASQSIKAIAFSVQERRYKTEKQQMQSENIYPPVPSCNQPYGSHMQHVSATPLTSCNHHHISQNASVAANTNGCLQNNVCLNKLMFASNSGHSGHVAGNYQNFVHPAIPHSKSLEHYTDQNLINLGTHSRHSFDQPSYDYGQRPYECVDGTGVNSGYRQGCGMDHPYNVSGNRYPLPATISNQLSQVDPYANDVPPPPPPPCGAAVYAAAAGSGIYSNTCMAMTGPSPCCHSNVFYECNHRQITPAIVPGLVDMNSGYGTTACAKYYPSVTSNANLNHRNASRTSQADHLIDLDDKTIVAKHTNGGSGTNHLKHDCCDPAISKVLYASGNEVGRHQSTRCDIKGKPSELSLNKQLKYLQSAHNSDEVDGVGGGRKVTTLKKSYNRNAELLAEYEDHIQNNDSRNSRASDFDSFDSSNNLSTDRGTDHSTASKIRDGVGSYETWDYVFQNLGKNGYNTQSKEANDLTMQGLDLDSMAIANASTEKRRSRNMDNTVTPTTVSTIKRSSNDAKTLTRRDVSHSPPPAHGPEKQLSSALKTNGRPSSKLVTTSRDLTPVTQKSALKTTSIDQHYSSQHHTRNERDEDFVIVGNRAKTGAVKKVQPKTMTPSTIDAKRLSGTPNGKCPSDTGRNATIEWGCKHCTFLNPTNTNICQMCYKSKDFVPDGPKASTCV